MVYVKKLWADAEIIEVNELNHLEDGIADAHTAIATINQQLLETVLDRMHLYSGDTAITLGPSAVDTSITDIDVTYSNTYSVQVSYTGGASSVEVAVFCANDGFEYSSTAIGVMTLTSAVPNDVLFLTSDYDKIKVRLTNKDTFYSAIVSVAIKVLTHTGSMDVSVYDPDIDGCVNSADVAKALTNGTGQKTYADISSEIDADILTHKNNASAHHTRYTDVEAVAAVNADVNHGANGHHNYRTDEEIRDVIGAMIKAGENISVDYNDVTDTLTIVATGFTTDQVTKLNGVEYGATADQTGPEIVALINASSSKIDEDNLNLSGSLMTAAQVTKLNGIETGATADQTAAEIIGLINASALKIDTDNLNLGTFTSVIERGFVGEVVAGDSLRIFMPRVGTIQSVTIVSGTQPVGENCMVDVRKNGVVSTNSIFTSDAPAILSTSATATNGVYSVNGNLDSAQTSITAGDVLRVFVTQAGAVVDLSVCIEVLF